VSDEEFVRSCITDKDEGHSSPRRKDRRMDAADTAAQEQPWSSDTTPDVAVTTRDSDTYTCRGHVPTITGVMGDDI
jgi:hypothetical protein